MLPRLKMLHVYILIYFSAKIKGVRVILLNCSYFCRADRGKHLSSPIFTVHPTLYFIISGCLLSINRMDEFCGIMSKQCKTGTFPGGKKKDRQSIRRRPCLLERTAGIEPVQSAWEAGILPLNYVRISNTDIIHHFPGFVKRFLKIYRHSVYFHRLWAKY